MGGVFIDYASERDSYANALLFPPWIEDRDGTAFRNLPAMRFKQSLDAGEGSNDAAPLAPVPFHHETPNNPEAQDDHV